MKQAILFVVNVINHIRLFLCCKKTLPGCKLLNTRVSTNKHNVVNTKKTILSKSVIDLNGSNNEISATNCLIHDSEISIQGTANKLIIHEGVKLRRAIIQMRGTGCSIEIGKNTTFGQVRIVNVGRNNPVSIGTSCLFADDIEIWASDTHSIYDETGEFINPEKPVRIENSVWVGSHVRILKGVTIHQGAIIGMNSVITKDIEAKSLCVGNPPRTLKQNVTWSLQYQNE